MNANISRLSAVIVTLVAFFHASNAHAFYYLSTTGTTAAGVYFVMQFMKKDAKAEAAQQTKEEAASWMKQNSVQLNRDLALASGPTVNDMATAMNISPEHAPRFRQILRDNRAELVELANADTVNADRAGKFLETITSNVMADPVLKADVEAAQGT